MGSSIYDWLLLDFLSSGGVARATHSALGARAPMRSKRRCAFARRTTGICKLSYYFGCPVDFLSPRSSLLAARVDALLAKPSLYGPQRKIALTVLAACCLILVALLVPETAISSYDAPVLVMVHQPSTPSSGAAPRTRRPRAQRPAVSRLSATTSSLQRVSLP